MTVWNTTTRAVYRRSKHWKNRVLQVKKRDKVCRICGSKRSLCVHHNNPNEEYDCDSIDGLLLLCRSCHLHIMHHNLPQIIREAVNRVIEGTDND